MKRLTIGIQACTETMGLLVAMAWADGNLDDEEREGIRAAATTFNLKKDLRDRLETFMDKARPISELELGELVGRDAEFAYVASAWMARIYEGIHEKEESLLDEIGKALKIGDERAEELKKLATDLSAPKDGETWSKGIAKLFKAIPAVVELSDEDIEADEDIEVAFE